MINYAIGKSVFGNIWVGETKLKPDGKRHIYKDKDEAIKKAQEIFCNMHEDFDPSANDDDEDDDYSMELMDEYNSLNETEPIRKGMEWAIIKKETKRIFNI